MHRNQRAHQRLNSYASWLLGFQDSSALGARIVNYDANHSGLPATSIVPDVFRAPELVVTEAAIDEQTPVVRRSIYARYIYSHDDPRYFKLTRTQIAYMLRKVADSLGY